MNADEDFLEKEYAKNEGLRRKEVLELAEWTRGQPHLPDINEFYAIHFLQSCFYDMEAAKRCVEAFFTMRATHLEIYANKSFTADEALLKVMDVCIFVPLSRPTAEGYSVYFAKFVDTDAARFDLAAYVKFVDMTLTLALRLRGTAPGVVVVVDQEGVSLGHMARMRYRLLRTCLQYVQEALPMRFKCVYYFNTRPYMDVLFNCMRRFLKQELVHLLSLHSTVDTVFEFVPKECFPSDYGGGDLSIDELRDRHRKLLFENASFFAEDEKLKADESKRVEKARNAIGLWQKTFKAMGLR